MWENHMFKLLANSPKPKDNQFNILSWESNPRNWTENGIFAVVSRKCHVSATDGKAVNGIKYIKAEVLRSAEEWVWKPWNEWAF